MASKKSTEQETAPVRIVQQLGEAFDKARERVRERAYQIFSERNPDQGDSITDWLNAQAQVLTPIELVVKEQKKALVVEANLAGFDPAEVELEIAGDELRIFGSHRESKSSNKGGVRSTTSESSHFFQSLPIPCAVEADECTATLQKNGKLKITLPRRKA